MYNITPMNHTKKPLTLSIVVPCYNEENVIVGCLEAIKAQTVLPKEVIVVDNNCTDKTIDIAKKYDFVKVVKEPKQGISYARTTGFEATKSDIIGRIDADSLIPPNWTEEIIKSYKKSEDMSWALTGPVVIRNQPLQHLVSFFFTIFYYRVPRIFAGNYAFNGSNMAMTKQVWNRLNKDKKWLTDDLYHEDTDLSLKASKLGIKIRFIPTIKTSILQRTSLKPVDLSNYLAKWHRTYRHYGYKTWTVLAIISYTNAFFIGISKKLGIVKQNILKKIV